MKLSNSLFAFLAVANAAPTVRRGANDIHAEADEYWGRYLQQEGSMSMTDSPTNSPTPEPSPEPSAEPSPEPSAEPSPEPSAAPSPEPTSEPSANPTGRCEAEVVLNCTFVLPGDTLEQDCQDLPLIDEPFCTCDECVRELSFVYTGASCDGLADCEDIGLSPFSPARVTFSPCDVDLIIFEGTVEAGDPILVSQGGVTCLPDCLDVTVTDPVTGELEQIFKIDSSCDDRNLLLKNSYASIDFVGYSCDETDINNCFQDIVYGVEACNDGAEPLTLYDFSFDFNGEVTDLLNGEQPDLVPGECFDRVVDEIVDRCLESDYIAKAIANATDPVTGPVCEDADHLNFTLTPLSLPPSPAPSDEPSAAPSASPSASPSAEPSAEPSPEPTVEPSAEPSPEPSRAPSLEPTPSSPAPTGDCNLNVTVIPECPVLSCNFDRCQQRPFRMVFRTAVRTCDQSDLRRCPGVDPDSCECDRNITIPEEDWPEQKYECTDFDGGPVDEFATYYVVSVPEKDPEVIYFNGTVQTPGGRFEAREPDGNEVEANTFLRLFEYDNVTDTPGRLLQEVLFHSSCSEQLFLLDIFGTFQLLEFENELQGVVGFANNATVDFNLTLSVDTDQLDLEFLNLVVLSPSDEILGPQVIEIDVDGVSIPPPFSSTEDVVLIPGVEFEVLTTIGGDLNGQGCFDVSSSTVFCEALAPPEFERNDRR